MTNAAATTPAKPNATFFLNHKADRRTVAYMVIITALLVVNWLQPSYNWALSLVQCAMAIPVAVMAHNHNHLKTFRFKPLNVFMDYWLTCFYGFPVFAWIPTHNQNHHRLTNKPGDYTITYRYSEKNNLATLLSYPTISGWFQQIATRQWLSTMKAKKPRTYWYALSQWAVLIAWVGTALALDWKNALLYVVLPQQISLTVVLIFNYIQHVHADEQSEWNHSRNITGWGLNFYLLNNGLHTAHHVNPMTHWADLPAEHARIEHLIDPRLNEPSFWGYFVKAYILGPFSDRFATHSMRLDRMAREGQAPTSAQTT